MTERSERDRDLIEKSAALLAADYPLDVIIERLSNTIATAMEATVFIALPNEDGTIRLSYVTQLGQRQETHEQLMPEGSRVANVFHSGRPIVLRTPEDWNGQEPYEINYTDLHQLPMLSALYVPVVYGDAVLAVLSVARPDAEQFDRDDMRVIESLARHLAVAIRNQRSSQLAAAPAGYPWLLVLAIAALTILAMIGTSLFVKERYDARRSDELSARAERAQKAADAIDRAISQDVHLADVAAAVAGPVRNDPAQVERLIERVLHTREDSADAAVGIYYQPGIFEPGPFAVLSHAGSPRVVADSTSSYLSKAWYRNALGGNGTPVLYGPFELQGRSYVSTLRAFREGATVAGVVRVDNDVDELRARMIELLGPEERGYIADDRGRVVVDTGPIRDVRSTTTLKALGRYGWSLHVVDADSRLQSALRAVVFTGVAIDLTIAMVGIFLIAAVHGAARARYVAVGLKMQRAELQQEIATRIDAEERLRAAAYHDALTGLPNRTFFLDQLSDVTSQKQRGGVEYAVLFIDLDRFHVINDSMGHTAGDDLLRAIGFRLQETVPPHALVARLGGDEFVLLLPSQGPVIREAVAIAEDILEALRNPFPLGEREVFTGASIGIVKVDETYEDAETVLRDADISMYQAKRAGRARYAIFDREMRDRITDSIMLEGALRGAVERKEIIPHYQPIVRLSDESIVGFEMLARWQYNGAFVPAADFIPVAEQNGMLRAIDAELFAAACRDAVEMASISPGTTFSVNVSANDLTRASLLADIEAMVQLYSTPPSLLRLEITETAVMGDAERALTMLHELRARGLQMTVDDFGVGYSSLSYLQRLPINGVKIDRSFISALPNDTPSLEIVRAIVALTRALGLSTTAEGVENAEQAEVLRVVGVTYAQGFHYARPLPFEDAKALFALSVE